MSTINDINNSMYTKITSFDNILQMYAYDPSQIIPEFIRYNITQKIEELGYECNDLTISIIANILNSINVKYRKYSVQLYCEYMNIDDLNITISEYTKMINVYLTMDEAYNETEYLEGTSIKKLNSYQVLRHIFRKVGKNNHAYHIPLLESKIKNDEYQRMFNVLDNTNKC